MAKFNIILDIYIMPFSQAFIGLCKIFMHFSILNKKTGKAD